jgi:hypothetical protein
MKHGLSNTREYRLWASMIARCHRNSDAAYSRYGGRGVSVCEEWRSDFKDFYDHITKLPGYGEPGRSIDRIDNNGNYEPGNIRWATNKQQSRNRRAARKNVTGYSGVNYRPSNKHSKFVAVIRIDGKTIHLGSYKTPEAAVERRNNYIISMGLQDYPVQEIV